MTKIKMMSEIVKTSSQHESLLRDAESAHKEYVLKKEYYCTLSGGSSSQISSAYTEMGISLGKSSALKKSITSGRKAYEPARSIFPSRNSRF
ncbi:MULTISPECIES: hypothetical protein [unclassified Pantoea]|jgi:hypothetical protein|uniref:hypothetical protein n=1 Tax=unclassified Pantoea TaxID=2630326 RepID=UPI0023D9DE8E|nr:MULTISPECIES: hypothetical protein [unclassified Pantoea]MDF2043815.1 hypothetical protein [Pantoea sp. Cr_R14]MDF2069814.1 hypothetical protein [Pantoea sp. Cr_R13]MDF2081417.1 hypothetical protein [Pantoea sp. Cr_R21]